ncbi:MAG: translation initiation factor IF-2 N-terminal domain-containing protein, partial [Blastocatellia bacterium]
MSKVRIYDLAKELKLESKKVLEDARRMGVDVSVPSNTLEDDIAAKIREKYYPKKKEIVASKPTARLIKHLPTAAAPALEKTPEATEPAPPTTLVVSESTPQRVVEVSAPPTPATVIKQLTRPAPPATPQPAHVVESKVEPPAEIQSQAEAPQTPEVVDPNKPRLVKLPVQAKAFSETAPSAESEISASQQVELETATEVAEAPTSPTEISEIVAQTSVTVEAEGPQVQPKIHPKAQEAPTTTHQPQAKPSSKPVALGTKVIKLAMPTGPLPKPSPTTSARFQTEKPKQPDTGKINPSMLLKKDQPRDGKDKKEAHLLPSGAQQRTVYIPPKDQKPKGRNQHRAKDKGKDKFQDGNTHKLGLRRQALPVAAQKMVPVDLKPARLIEGSTVREFAEKLDVKARDVVAALMQRGVMATINQIMNHDL